MKRKILRTALPALLLLMGTLLAGCQKKDITPSPVKEYPASDIILWSKNPDDDKATNSNDSSDDNDETIGSNDSSDDNDKTTGSNDSSDGGETQNCKHVFGPATIVKKATCTEKGTAVSVCTLCGLQKNEEIPETGHNAVSLPGKTATCTSAGLSEGSKCSACGAILEEQIPLQKLEHSYSDWIVEQASTCSTNGVKKRTCRNCGETESESLERTDHTYLAGKCSVCGQSQPACDGLKFSLSSDGSSYVCDGFASYTASYKSVVIPSTYNGKPVTEIGKYAFYYKSIEYIMIPNSITKIGDFSFGSCNKLTSVTIPDSVTRIGDCAFANCGNLETVHVSTSGWKSYTGNAVSFSDPYETAQILRKYGICLIYVR